MSSRTLDLLSLIRRQFDLDAAAAVVVAVGAIKVVAAAEEGKSQTNEREMNLVKLTEKIEGITSDTHFQSRAQWKESESEQKRNAKPEDIRTHGAHGKSQK